MSYLGNQPGNASQRVTTTFSVASTTTTFTPTSGYTIGYIDVYLNGVKLVAGDDFTATNGTTVVLASAAVSGDVVETVAYIPRGLSDGYTKSEADAKYPLKPTGTPTGSKFLRDDNSWQTITAPSPTAVSDQANTSTGYFDLPAGTTAQRPASPNSGMARYNTDINAVEVYSGTSWQSVFFGYLADVLVVGGGGGGGWDVGGGGGAGGYQSFTSVQITSSTTYTVIVGAGGASTSSNSSIQNGGSSTFGTFATSVGGGSGGNWNNGGATSNGQSGGSGGGGGGYTQTTSGGSGTSGQGYAGGAGNSSANAQTGGGGGGAGGAGSNSVSNISGYASGGAGLTWLNGSTYCAGGKGGGDTWNGNATGAANTGNGGDGQGGGLPTNGGSGVVIVRYLGSQRGSGGTVTSVGGYTYHSFTTSGTFTFTG
jgi:hypothetical protein